MFRRSGPGSPIKNMRQKRNPGRIRAPTRRVVVQYQRNAPWCSGQRKIECGGRVDLGGVEHRKREIALRQDHADLGAAEDEAVGAVVTQTVDLEAISLFGSRV